uniref:Uncharacterized protein n=1 Tax=Plectus sambesii TaxID=2011161 RepID=A0A914X6A3_9BILA
MAAYELGSARSYYGMSESIPYEQPPQKPPSGCRTALVIAAIVFGVLISVAVVAAIVLVFMQELRVPYYESGVSYPRYNQISYPKAGVDRQPTVFLWIWDKANNATKLLLPPEELFGLDDAYYLFSASWLRYVREDGSQMEVLSAVWSNRLQNEVFISLCTYESSQCVLNHRQSFTVNNKSLWAEPTDFRIRFQSKTGYFVVLPHVQADRHHVLAELNESVQFDLPSVKFMQITLDDRFESSVRLILPPELDPTLPIKYPLLVLVYAGPGSNAAKAQTPWSLLTYFASKRRYVIACIDGRGSGGRGWDVKGPIYRNLGGPEVDDQIATVTKLKQLLPYLDDKAVGVFGWSYGGFVSAHIAARDAGRTFPCVAAIAAVTDYRLYDTAYTERYMGLVGNNTSGYERSNVLKNITGFQHVDFLLAHGEADDNVHYQNSALLAYALQERGIHFRQLVYTNQDHSIATARPHLYRELDMFFDECFKTSSTANTEPSSSVAPFTT